MKKPLHDPEEQFLIASKGKIIGWGLADVKNFIANANRAKNETLRLEAGIPMRDAECLFALEWLEEFENGITPEVIKKLNAPISHIRYHHVLMHSPGKLPYWKRIANGDQIYEPELSVAYGAAHLLAAGGFIGLKRCRMKTCRNFFIGRPDSKWCSKACGSKFRVSQKRRRDRA